MTSAELAGPGAVASPRQHRKGHLLDVSLDGKVALVTRAEVILIW